MSTPFENSYQKLNPEQKQAVDTIEGPVMVIAGPGTGKTQILTLRIANILQNVDVNPRNILALTFTEAATSTMKKRLIDLIGTAGYSVRVQTFHGFCQEVISAYPEYFPFGEKSIPASDIQTHAIMEKLLDNPKLVSLRTPGSKYHYLQKILSAINTLKSEGIPPAKFRDLVKAEKEMFEQERESFSKTVRTKKESALAKQEELLSLYISYQQELRAQGLIDFTDMIVHTVEALKKSENLRTLLQENLQYILVDEYQDTNGAQNTVVDLLASFWGTAANVFVVGDPHQTIFRFQGASFENTIGFLTRYPAAQVITLETGYRCPNQIYTAAHALIQNNTSSQTLLTALAIQNVAVKTLVDGISKPLLSAHTTPDAISLAVLPTSTVEPTWIANQIKKQIASGLSASDIAILVKTNDQATQISHVLSQYEIPHHVDRTIDALTTEFGQHLLTLLRTLTTITTNNESPYLYAALSAPWMQLPSVAVMSLTRAFSKQRSEASFIDYILSGWTHISKSGITQLQKEDYELVVQKVDKLLELSQLSRSFAIPNWMATVFEEIGITSWIQSQANLSEYLSILTAFHTFAISNYCADYTFSASKLISLFDTMELQGLSLGTISLQNDTTTVTIATIHKAKGREWEYVYIPFLRDGLWGGGKGRSGISLPEGIIATQTEDDVLEDDRRLFYVALTRAKQNVILSYPQTHAESGKETDSLPSQLVLELPKKLITTIDTSTHDQIDSTIHTLQPIVSQPFGKAEREWIRSIVADMSLSVSALNLYLRDPKEFFLTQILRVPQPVQSHLAFGNAIHKALEQYYKAYAASGNTYPDEKVAIQVFEDALKRDIVSPSDLESRLVQGREVLSLYIAEKRTEFPQVLATEEGFGWKRGPILLGDIKLSGKVDRMDVLDESSRLIQIVDYKTGKQKTVNQIEGKVGVTEMSERERNLPEVIRGSMKRQLLFYKLLLSRDPLYKQWNIGKATFDFVQNDGGKFVERSFELPNDDVKLLENLIKEVMIEIRELQFLE
ncbi:MAG: ATP-dependent DNA helicase [Candidatus Woesebacteria bacterium]